MTVGGGGALPFTNRRERN